MQVTAVRCGIICAANADNSSMSGPVLLRGLRGASDIEYETAIANENLALAAEIATVFIPAQLELSDVSSVK